MSLVKHLLASRSLLVVVSIALLQTAPVVEADNTKELNRVRERIQKLEKDIQSTTNKRDKEQGRLANAERLISQVQENIARLDRERSASEARLAELSEQKTSELNKLRAKKTELATLVFEAYVSGRQEKLKLLLSQKDPSELGRAAVYYQYLNSYRLEEIEQVNQLISNVEQLTAQAELQNQSIQTLQKQRQVELQSLTKARATRKAVVARLNENINAGASQVSRLKAEEERLEGLIKELEAIMDDYPVGNRASFASLKGKLAWPVKGRQLVSFGKPRNGSSIRWDGILIGAKRGTPVRAVARGRVAYADWLPGQGLLVVLEHGDGYFSLYGRNETITAKPGDWIEAGEQIASVGDSGGQSEVALYFALRQKQKAVNPKSWFKTPKSD